MPPVDVPSEISSALGPLTATLAARGLHIARFVASESFGDFEVVFSRDDLSFSIVRDRGQFLVGGVERSVLEAAGLWRTFSGPHSVAPPLLAWLESQNAV